MSPTIRSELPEDRDAIRRIHEAAFPTPLEAALVDRLRDEGYARVSLVADVDEPVGHILFSRLAIVTTDGEVEGLSLAPLAVLPAFQRRGIGSQLIAQGLATCARLGHTLVLVVGEPSYYGRFGFSAELARTLETPYAGDYFMALDLVSGALHGVRGSVVYPQPFQEL